MIEGAAMPVTVRRASDTCPIQQERQGWGIISR
jgi:hypothetical protein